MTGGPSVAGLIAYAVANGLQRQRVRHADLNCECVYIVDDKPRVVLAFIYPDKGGLFATRTPILRGDELVDLIGLAVPPGLTAAACVAFARQLGSPLVGKT